MKEDWNWPADVKAGDRVAVPITGREGEVHWAEIFVLSTEAGMIVGTMPLEGEQ